MIKWRTRGTVRAAGALLALALAGCVAPAPTLSAYRSKAARTASDALSQVQTARLVADQVLRGRVTFAYAKVVVSDAEDAYGSIQQTFDSVQPPDEPAADRARQVLDGILADGADLLGQLRIELRRQGADQLSKLSEELGPVVAKLSDYDPAAIR
jgi:hypothetical protein